MKFFSLIKDRVQLTVFICIARCKLTQFHQLPSNEILGYIEETVQTPHILLQKSDR